MITEDCTLVRIYIREAEYLLSKVIDFLHDEAKVKGVTVLRGIEGFSENGILRTVSLMNLSLDLPLVVEFYDDSDKVPAILATLVDDMGLPHIISLPVKAYKPSVKPEAH